ncbi:MAG: NAD(P)-dependent oxidoreductase [Acholeplasmataceae bacterium]|nr:NAD(P)-dependent oxidoreductase [Acholeplasmataceae bacterium]
MKILWIGTGVMGAPMAKHVQAAGHTVYVYNRTDAKAKALEPDCIFCEDIKKCIKEVDAVFTIVGFPEDVKEVYDVILKEANPKTICVDMTTSSPTLAKEIYQKGKEKGLYMLDSPVTGGDLGAINASLSIMVGGEYSIYEKVLPILELMGKTITYMGDAGSGMYAKLVNQTVIAGNILGIAEGLTLAKSKNLDLDSMLNVITGGSASSWQAKNNGRKMIDKDYEPGFFIKHYLKDLKLAMAEKEDLDLKGLEIVTKAYQVLSDKGFSENGTQALIEYYIQKMM